jgi:NAD-dependent deacetylase
MGRTEGEYAMGETGDRELDEIKDALTRAQGIVVLTGAGVSAESGVPTFRAPSEGLWARFRPEELATPQAFARDARLVWAWYEWRRERIRTCEPNPGHHALARFLLDRPDVTLVTQNVDGLHDLALSLEAEGYGAEARRSAEARVLHLHGDIFVLRCSRCAFEGRDRSAVKTESEAALPRCRDCGELLRPGVVWFGEPLPAEALEQAFDAAGRADLCLVAGTSALVHPAASVPRATLASGGELIEVNPEPTALSALARWRIRGASGRVLPALLGTDHT